MKEMRKSLFGKIVAVCLMSLFLTAANVSPVMASIQVRHKTIGFFVPEKRIRLEARIIKDDSEIKLVRCYFRATEQADYVFVSMDMTKEGAYAAILPAPSKETTTIQYLFLIVNQNNQPIKTQVYAVGRKESNNVPSWQQINSEGTIQVSTEVGEAQASVAGFSDSITMNVVESSARFGLVTGGIYTASATSAAGTGVVASGTTVSTATGAGAATTGAAATGAGTTAGAVAGGTVATGTAVTAGTAAGIGISTGAMIGVGVGAAALVGGVAAANSGGNDPIPPTPDTVSTWEFHSRCANSAVESPVVFNIQLNETKGGAFSGSGSGQRADYEGGIPITMSIDNGGYDAKTLVISGRVTTTTSNLPFSCQRFDNFSFVIPSGSNDTGYQNVIEQGGTCGTESGCVMQVMFVKK